MLSINIHKELINFIQIINFNKHRNNMQEELNKTYKVSTNSVHKSILNFLDLNLKYFDNMQLEIEIFAPFIFLLILKTKILN